MDNLNTTSPQECSSMLAIPTIKCQQWNGTYDDLCLALSEGTIFPELNMPFYMGGNKNG